MKIVKLDFRQALYTAARDEWRTWLERNHARNEEGVWLVFYKKHTGKPSLPYEDAVEEALCFGWIDSLVRRVDEDRYIQKFTPRKKGSSWSPSNKKRVQKLIRRGLMTEAGLTAINEAKRSGSWSRLDRIEQLSVVPAELQRALTANKEARDFFRAAAPSIKKQFLRWLESAKREETRKKRITEIVKLAARKKTMRDYFYRRAEAAKGRRSS